MDWPTGKFKAILADPPWDYRVCNWKRTHEGFVIPYRSMSVKEIGALPVSDIATDDCVMFLWAIYPLLPQAFEVLRAWGFRYSTVAFTWIKTYPGSTIPFIGMGNWTRSNAEICLLATKGKPARRNGAVEQALLSPVREHSRKPDVIHERIERLVEGPYLELFARSPRPGWTTWGNETDKFPYQASLWKKGEVANDGTRASEDDLSQLSTDPSRVSRSVPRAVGG